MPKKKSWGGRRKNQTGRPVTRKLKPGEKWRVVRYIATDAEHAEIKARLRSPEEIKVALCGNWRQIDSAPTTGRVAILIWRKGMDFPQLAFSDTWWLGGFPAWIKPTHWMPLQEPATEEK